ncbi:MAG: STAS domain-containing protein [Candidatus Omnitrophica bacterium]|nr:STAS domain-containing protein [Candidatus Omnitrophota bacterium]MDD5488080.1 STAS domain-containing protein [Candidatus Omnitrophota bacterium]
MLFEFFTKGRKGMAPYVKQIEAKGDVHIVRLKGRIDMYTIPEVDKLRHRALRGSLRKNILLDFKNVEHVDSATCALLVQSLSELKHVHHRLVLINISDKLKGMLKIARISRLFDVFDSEEKALEELAREDKEWHSQHDGVSDDGK